MLIHLAQHIYGKCSVSQRKRMVAGNTDISFKIAFSSNEQYLHSSHKYVVERERLADVKSHKRECWYFPREYSFESVNWKEYKWKKLQSDRRAGLWVRRPRNLSPVLLKVFCVTQQKRKEKKLQTLLCLIQPNHNKAVEFHYLHAYLQMFILSK